MLIHWAVDNKAPEAQIIARLSLLLSYFFLCAGLPRALLL